MLGLIERTAPLKRLQAALLVAEEVKRLDLERVAGLKVRGLGTEHLYGTRLPRSPRWPQLAELSQGVSRAGWRELPGPRRPLRDPGGRSAAAPAGRRRRGCQQRHVLRTGCRGGRGGPLGRAQLDGA
jgi:hypothetical protein